MEAQNQNLRIAKEKAEENEAKLELMFKTSPIGICTVDTIGNFITTNLAYERIVGYSKEELSGLSFFDVTSKRDRPRNKKLFQKLFSLETTSFSLKKRYVRKDGKEIIVVVNAFAIRDAEGKVRYGTAFIEDVTEQNKAEVELQLYQKHLEELVRERTKNLEEKNKELERFNDLFVDRELRIHELNETIKRLKNE